MRKWLVAAVLAVGVLIGAGTLVYVHPFLPIGYGDARQDEVFKDCADCPDMLPIPPGRFLMGSYPRRDHWMDRLGLGDAPRRKVTVARPFAIGRHEVTFAEWEACVLDGGCNGYLPPDEGWGRGERPVIHVSWNDAQAYVRWLSKTTGKRYRLPTEAEWEHAARAGTTTAYSWGKTASHDLANYGHDDCSPCTGLIAGRDVWLNTAPVGQFPPNRFGVHDVHGNVYEWVEDCFVADLPAVATDAAVVRARPCGDRPMRGAAWYSDPKRITSYYRAHNPPHHRDEVIGFRVARSL